MRAAPGAIEVTPRRPRVFLAALAVYLLLGGCAGDGSPLSTETESSQPPQQSKHTRLIESTLVTCAVGERPDYFVPADSPPALLGCARLAVSGKRVEFSGTLARIDGGFHLCINPAYNGRGQRGIFIPAICKLEPAPSEFAIRAAGQPRQGVRGYEYVVWGTAAAGTSDVVAHSNAGRARASVFQVPSDRAPWSFGESPFSLFVVELPLAAACGSVTVARDGRDATERIPPKTTLCLRARDSGSVGHDGRR